MAKLVYLILLLLFLLLPVFGSSFYVAFDVMSLDSFIADGNRVSFDFSYRYGDFRISLPVSYSFCLDDDISALDVALRVDAYPFRDIELFFGVDVLRPADDFLLLYFTHSRKFFHCRYILGKSHAES